MHLAIGPIRMLKMRLINIIAVGGATAQPEVPEAMGLSCEFRKLFINCNVLLITFWSKEPSV